MIVVGAGDSAAQVANELAPVATVTIATRHPFSVPQRLDGKDVHYWFRETGFDTLPAIWLRKITGGSVVTDSVGFAQTLAEGRVDRRPMFTALDGERVIWSDGQREPVDAIILATGYRPSCATCNSSALSTSRERRCMSAGSLPPTSAWCTSGSSPALLCLQHAQGCQRRRRSGDRTTRRLGPGCARSGRTGP